MVNIKMALLSMEVNLLTWLDFVIIGAQKMATVEMLLNTSLMELIVPIAQVNIQFGYLINFQIDLNFGSNI